MSISGIGDLSIQREKKEAVIDTREKSRIKTQEEQTNGYNEIKVFEKNPNEYMNKPADDFFELKGRQVNAKGTCFGGNFRIIAEKERDPFEVSRKRNVKAFEKGKISKDKGKDVSRMIRSHINTNHEILDDIAEENLTSVSSKISDLTELFGKEIPKPVKNDLGDITFRNKMDCKKQIDRDCIKINKSYDEIIKSIDKCLLNENGELDGNDELKKTLEDLKKQCEIEKEEFKDKIYQFADDAIDDPKLSRQHHSWGDALEYARESNSSLGIDKIDYKLVQRFNTPKGANNAPRGNNSNNVEIK